MKHLVSFRGLRPIALILTWGKAPTWLAFDALAMGMSI